MRLAYSRKEWKAAICRYRDQVLPIVKLVNRRFIIASSYRRRRQLNSEPQERLEVVGNNVPMLVDLSFNHL